MDGRQAVNGRCYARAGEADGGEWINNSFRVAALQCLSNEGGSLVHVLRCSALASGCSLNMDRDDVFAFRWI